MAAMSPDSIAESYTSSNMRKHRSANPLQRRLIAGFHDAAGALLAQTNARSVLDAGCGEGFAMRYLMGESRAAVVGLDGSASALRVAGRINPGRSFIAGDLLRLPFPDRSFDLVICIEVLEHLDRPEQGLAELRRASRRWLLLSVPNEPLFRGANFLRGKNIQAWGNDPGHVNHWSARAFLRFVASQCRVVAWRRSFPWTLALCRAD
jgi:SAM-dependent methyltransferase